MTGEVQWTINSWFNHLNHPSLCFIFCICLSPLEKVHTVAIEPGLPVYLAIPWVKGGQITTALTVYCYRQSEAQQHTCQKVRHSFKTQAHTVQLTVLVQFCPLCCYIVIMWFTLLKEGLIYSNSDLWNDHTLTLYYFFCLWNLLLHAVVKWSKLR